MTTTYKNSWIKRKAQKTAIQEINSHLKKFIGHDVQPLNDLLAKMRKVVIKYFRNNPDQQKHFDNQFDYDFEIEEKGGIIINVECHIN